MCFRLAAQLARTEEAAKRALARSDQGAKGSTVQQLLDAQRQVQQLQAENSELSNKLARWVGQLVLYNSEAFYSSFASQTQPHLQMFSHHSTKVVRALMAPGCSTV